MQAPTRPTGEDPALADRALCEVELRATEQSLTLEVRGTLDASTLPALTAQIDQLECTPAAVSILDIHRVSVLDYAGCHAIAGLAHSVALRGGRLRIRCGPGAIARLLAGTGLAACLEDVSAAPPADLLFEADPSPS